MYFFFTALNFVQIYYEIYPFLDQKCETRNNKYEVSLDKNYPNDVIIWMVMPFGDVERLAEDLYTRFGITLLQMLILNTILLMEMF
jgi:hypothetical protein